MARKVKSPVDAKLEIMPAPTEVKMYTVEGTGKTITQHRCWDADRFIATRQKDCDEHNKRGEGHRRTVDFVKI